MSALLAIETLNVENVLGFRSAQNYHLSLPLTLALRLAVGTLLNFVPGRTVREDIPRSFVHVLIDSLKRT
jgi:hypothetical protein